MGRNDRVIQRYLEEGLVALLPGYREGEGGTQVYTLQGVHHDPHSLPWLVEVLARFYRLDLAAVRRHTGRLLELSHHIPLPLAEGIVLLPVKVRQAASLGENTTGYINLLQVEGVEAVGGGNGNGGNGANGENGETSEMNGGGPKGAAPSSGEQTLYTVGDPAHIRSRIVCRGGLVICCLNTAATVKAKLRQGESARQELLQRQRFTAGPVAPFTGLKDEGLRELLPSCDCLLRNFFLLLLDSASRLEPERREQAPSAAAPAASVSAGKK
ncbi:MAG: hypothetical protein AB1796_07685 [Bacillota bacterium]